ncbi:MAG: hypothetical protein HRU43_00640 [Simkaniaceae bacterium]|nr:hypothetical protein [Simkaniaceae bacterium]
MEQLKSSFYRVDKEPAQALLFLSGAFLAGKARALQVLTSMTHQGMIGAAATSSIGLALHYVYSQTTPGDKGLESAVSKSALVSVINVLGTGFLTKKICGEVALATTSLLGFSGMTTAVILGTYLLQNSFPLPSREINLQTLEEDIASLERVPLDQWKFTDKMKTFNPDEILAKVHFDDVRGRYNEIFNGMNIPAEDLTKFKKNVRKAYAKNCSQGKAIAWYLDKIFSSLLLKKNSPLNVEAKRELDALINNTVDEVNGAFTSCEDQVLSMLQDLAVYVAGNIGMSTAEKSVALEALKYRNSLIKEAIAKVDAEESADLEIDLSRSIYQSLGASVPRSLEHGAKWYSYRLPKYYQAKYRFTQDYMPVLFLVKEINLYELRICFARMSQWFQKELFEKHPELEDRFVKAFGCDFLMDSERNDVAVLYFLYKTGLITI